MKQNDPIPVTVLTGFLGAGKTTLLNRILTEQHGQRIAVIENEFGEVGIDNELVIGADEEIFEMNNGCICCTVRGDQRVDYRADNKFGREAGHGSTRDRHGNTARRPHRRKRFPGRDLSPRRPEGGRSILMAVRSPNIGALPRSGGRVWRNSCVLETAKRAPLIRFLEAVPEMMSSTSDLPRCAFLDYLRLISICRPEGMLEVVRDGRAKSERALRTPGTFRDGDDAQ